MKLNWIINKSDLILVTGANGFIGPSLLKILLEYGFTRIRCLVRPSRKSKALSGVIESSKARIEIFQGDLLSQTDCNKFVKDAAVIYHLAVGPGGKSFPGSFFNTVIPTRNLIEASLQYDSLRRFVNTSSFAVYSNQKKLKWRLLDELCPIDEHPDLRGDAYAFAKLKQDYLVYQYAKKRGLKYTIVRPGTVYGPEKNAIPGRVGIDTFGIFLHLGGSNSIPFTYVDNCAEAIVLAGIIEGIDGEIFNVVDDDLPSSRRFLRLYKKHVKRFRSIYIPKIFSYLLCYLWGEYSTISEGQLPAVFTKGEWHAYWKKTRYSNMKVKRQLGWKMRISTDEGLKRYFEGCKAGKENA